MLTDCLIVRDRRPGDRMVPFGRRVPARVKKLIAAACLTIRQKQRIFVVCQADDTIIWIPRVRRAAIGELSDTAEDVIELRCRELE